MLTTQSRCARKSCMPAGEQRLLIARVTPFMAILPICRIPAGAHLLMYLRMHRVPFLIMLSFFTSLKSVCFKKSNSPTVFENLSLILWDWRIFARVLQKLLRTLFQVFPAAVEVCSKNTN